MFYNRVNAPTRIMLDVSANDTILNKSLEEAFEILNRLSNNDYRFSSTRKGPTRRNAMTFELDPSDTITPQFVPLTNMVKSLQRPKNSQEVNIIEPICDLCNANHDCFECPHNPKSIFYVGNCNRNNNPYYNTYNPGWRQHLNFHGIIRTTPIVHLARTLKRQDFNKTCHDNKINCLNNNRQQLVLWKLF
ncbi:hypothetical protein GQ457_02G025630 [Hibiscus cannabinus]